MCAISSFYSKQVNRGLNYRPQPLCQLLGTLITRSRSVAPLSAQYQCDIMIAIYRISLSLTGNELGIVRNRPKQPNQTKWRRHLGSDLNFGPVQNEHLVVRTYDHWPLRASGFLGPLARLAPRVKNTRRASGPVVNVEACA